MNGKSIAFGMTIFSRFAGGNFHKLYTQVLLAIQILLAMENSDVCVWLT